MGRDGQAANHEGQRMRVYHQGGSSFLLREGWCEKAVRTVLGGKGDGPGTKGQPAEHTEDF